MKKYMKWFLLIVIMLMSGCEVEPEETVLLPNVKGYTTEQAVENLAILGLTVSLEYVETDSVMVDLVIDYKSPVSSGNRITKGQEVTLIISKSRVNREPIVTGLSDVLIEPGMDFDFLENVEATDYTGVSINQFISIDYKNFNPLIEGNYTIEYSVIDFDNRSITITRNVRVTEDRLPKILNIFDMTVMQYFSDDFLFDIIAVDYLSRNISQSLAVSNNHDFSVVGEHVIALTATDAQGRIGTKTITVTVVETYNDPERLNALASITLPSEITNGLFLPKTVNGFTVRWKTLDDRFIISDDSYIYSMDSNVNVSLYLTGAIDKEGVPSVEQTFKVDFKTSAYYQFPQTYVYDGPAFPTHALSLPFFGGGRGGLIEVTMDRCIDGDTTRFFVEGTSESTRYFNIDTRETYPIEASTPFGEAAKVFTCQMLSNATTIHLQSDPGDGPRDVHQRLLGWVWVDGELLQYHLVRRGLAEVRYLFGANLYTSVLQAAQRSAQDEKQGYWGDLLDPYWPYY